MVRRAFFYVQHLLGIGHLRRTATFARAVAARGLDVTLVSGGSPVPNLDLGGVRFVQLPPATAADLTFKSLVDAQNNPVDEEWKSKRRNLLLDAWRASNAHVLVIELYPFGRRQMRFELEPLLEAARAAPQRPLIFSSVRDILGGGNPVRQDGMLEVFERCFDRVMVHGDEAVVPFSRTFRHAHRIASKLEYTGYIVDDEGADSEYARPANSESCESGEVIVSAGGGAVGVALLESGIRARALSTLASRTWRILCGVNVPAFEFARLAGIASAASTGEVIVERARDDFRQRLARCAVSVSQAGYNTMLEVVQAEARSVVVPFSAGGETEQGERARAFEALGLTTVLTEEHLSPRTLAIAVDEAASRPRPSKAGIDLGGAKRSAELLDRWTSGAKC